MEGEFYGVSIHPEFALGRFCHQLQASAHAWRILLGQIEAGDFWEAGQQRVTDIPHFMLSDEKLSPEELIQFANSEVVLGVIRALIDYMDTVIGLKRLRGLELELDRDLVGIEDIQGYLDGVVADQARTVGADASLSNPEKVEEIGVRDPNTKVAILSLFDLRQALEHHKRVATRRNIDLSFYRLRVQVEDGEEFVGQPMDVREGQRTVTDFVKETRVFSRSEPVVLSERDIELIVQSLALGIGPNILQAAFAPTEPSLD